MGYAQRHATVFCGAFALIRVGLEGRRTGTANIDDTDSTVGLWVGGGVYWTLKRHFNIGFDLRLSGAEVTLFGKDRQAGGFHSGLILGYHWDCV
ncbi:MAG: hypothetical protein JSW10_01535 [Pseudomonadota bacterium]|nr:MAG: hypothetical protein JSW10_01535 [Pseudomonadota bacterium]